jgi:hypothetical protein
VGHVRAQWPARSFQRGSGNMRFRSQPVALSVSALPIAFLRFKSVAVIGPPAIPGRLRRAFCTYTQRPSSVNAMRCAPSAVAMDCIGFGVPAPAPKWMLCG